MTPANDLHQGAMAVLGPPLPRNPQSRLFLAAKAGAACAIALMLDHLTGNPDHVTSTFVAVLSVSPVVLMGLRRSLDQVMGSFVGGIWGGGAMAIGLGPDIGIPLAVGLSVLSAFGLGFGHGYTAAAFTALFVQAVPFGGPLETLGVRFLAVGTATVSAFAVNVLLSAAAYRSIFRRRVRFAEATVSSLLVRAVEEGPTVVQAGFPMVVALEAELASALGELRLRRSRETAAWLAGLAEHVASLRRLLHLVFELSYRLEEEGLPKGAMKPWLNWLVHAGGQEPEVHAALAVTTRRIRELGKTLRPQGDKRGATRRPK